MRLHGGAAAAGLLVLAVTMAVSARSAAGQVMDRSRYLYLFGDHLEQAPGFAGRPVRLEGEGWYGRNYDRFWMKFDGDLATQGNEGELQVQALFSHLFSPYWDIQAGIRVDGVWGEAGRVRPHAVIGVQGLAPYWFEVESALFVSDAGDVSGRLQASYDLMFTQRLIFEPEVELNAALQEVPEWGVGSGLTSSELGLRLRYEIRREFAPYIGYLWQRSYAGTANLLHAGGEPPRRSSFVAGVTVWY